MHWIAKRGAVERYTKSILGKDSDVIQALVNSLPEKFDFRAILESACTMYRDLVDSNLWDPINQKDKGKAPAAFITKAEFNTVVQKQVSLAIKTGNGNQRKYYERGSPDHLKLDCPKLKDKNNTNNNSQDDKKKSWRRSNPQNLTEMMRNGKKWFWCATCGWWNTTHTTEQHKSGIGKNNTPTTTVATLACVEIDPNFTFEWVG